MLGTSVRSSQGACPRCRPCSAGPCLVRPRGVRVPLDQRAPQGPERVAGWAPCAGSLAADGRTINHEATSHVDPRAITEEGCGGGSRGVLPGSSSAVALLGAQPIPSIATTSIPAFQESGLPASHVLKAYSQRPGTISRAQEGQRRSRTGAGIPSTMTVTNRSPPHAATRARRHRSPERLPSASGHVRAAPPLQRVGGVGRVPTHAQASGDAGHGGVSTISAARAHRPAASRPTRSNPPDQHG